jgi:hypothetical protein
MIIPKCSKCPEKTKAILVAQAFIDNPVTKIPQPLASRDLHGCPRTYSRCDS